jgi:hypothetical protein
MWFSRVIQRNQPQGHQHRVLRAETQGLAVLLAVVKQVPLVALQHGPRDVVRILETTVGAPADKHSQLIMPGFDGLLGVLFRG